MKPITKVIVDGANLSEFKHLSLEQTMYDHHSFKIIIGHEVVEDIGSNTLDKSKDWLGKAVVILLGETAFVGIVTSVNMQHGYGLFGDLVVSGYSQSILLEAGPHLCSWTDKALRDIVDEVMSGLKSTIKPKYQSTIGYMTQYRESNFQFLKRIACQYNEWFFYDGEKLIFGEPDDKPVIPLVYGTDMDDVTISLKVKPVKFEAFSYQSMLDQKIEGTTQDSVKGLGDLGNHAFKASKDTFIFKSRISSGPRIPDKGGLDDMLENLQNSAAANLSMASGNSSKQDLRPGVIVDFKANIFNVGAWKTKPFGQYLVTKVHHQSTGVDTYTNYFEAVPAGVKALPEPETTMPIAYPQIATVLSNEDPDKKGRIQVQFQWQMIDGLHTNWIRVMTPDAGVSDKVGTNRGSVFIPEKGDQVMVGFRYGDPTRPFVMGSLFHGISGTGGDMNNKVKSITTRSGSSITFNDDENDGNITINDPSGNVVIMDGAGNITMSAPNKISLYATDILMHAGNSITMNSQPGEDENSTGEGTFMLSAKKKIEVVSDEDNIELTASEKDINVTAAQKGVTLASREGEFIIESKKINVSSTTTSTLISNATTQIQGSEVEINKG